MDRELHNLLFGIEKSLRYHQRRHGFFARCHRMLMLLIIISGAAAFINDSPEIAALVAAVLAAIELAVGFGTKAKDHQVLFQRFADLNRRIRKSIELAPEKFAAWREDRLAIEADEPAMLYALEADCHNEVARAWGLKEDDPPILRWYERLFMHVWSFESSDFSSTRRALIA